MFMYRYLPTFTAAFDGLRHRVEAIVHRGDGTEHPAGVMVALSPGDHIESDKPITAGGDSDATHPFLQPVDSIPTPPAPAPTPVADPPAAPLTDTGDHTAETPQES